MGFQSPPFEEPLLKDASDSLKERAAHFNFMKEEEWKRHTMEANSRALSALLLVGTVAEGITRGK
jgi:hypothetical protein